jgi:hypothetical protein
MFAIADNASAHQKMHDGNDHHVVAEFTTTSLDSSHTFHVNDNQSNSHQDDAHPDCHQHHCHHGSTVYLEIGSLLLLDTLNDKHRITPINLFISYSVSPDLRPPIV